MALIIDGYNLLNAAGLTERRSGKAGLRESRQALLNFLAWAIDSKELARTIVVFDAGKNAPRNLPRSVRYRGMTVKFAAQYDDADTLIEQLIRQDSAPRSLTVVSSDRRLQRAARRRRATAIDSNRWYADARQRRQSPGHDEEDDEKSAHLPLSAEEIEYWLNHFEPQDSDEAENI